MNLALPTRTYQLIFEHRPGYLYVYIGCERVSLEIARRYWAEILAMIHRRGYQRLLLEKEIGERLPAHDVFNLVNELAHSGCSDVAFAVVDRFYEAERAEFEQMVATNRGLRMKVTNDMPTAERWLMNYHAADVILPMTAPMAVARAA